MIPRLGRPTFRDAIAGLVTGLFSIPEGMAYASIGGFNPVAGLYSGMVSTILGSLFARTVLMVTTLTSALTLSSRSVLAAAGLYAQTPAMLIQSPTVNKTHIVFSYAGDLWKVPRAGGDAGGWRSTPGR